MVHVCLPSTKVIMILAAATGDASDCLYVHSPNGLYPGMLFVLAWTTAVIGLHLCSLYTQLFE